MTFPYSHMSRDELISRAELEGDALAKALARELDDAQIEVEEARGEDESREDDLNAAEQAKDEAEQENEEAWDRIKAATALIPAKTSHKTLTAIRDTLNAD